jgi:hypothetical protein
LGHSTRTNPNTAQLADKPLAGKRCDVACDSPARSDFIFAG